MKVSIQEIKKEDFKAVMAIYNQGIQTGQATFQTELPTWKAWDESHCKPCRLLIKKDHQIMGWAALNPVSSRAVYKGVAEVSIYIKADYRKQGYGKMLLLHLIEEAEINGFWTLQSSVFPENISSIKLHKTCGFKVVGLREKLGKMKETWRDVYLLERRSQEVGLT